MFQYDEGVGEKFMKTYFKKITGLLLVLAMVMVTKVPAQILAQETTNTNGSSVAVERLAGNNRVDTAIAVSKKAYAGKVQTLFLAGFSGDADALTATFRTGKMNAPLLLSDKTKLSTNLINEINRLDPKEIIILGGENAVSKNIQNELVSKNYNVRRIEGKSRVETAVNVTIDYYKNTTIPDVFVVEYNSLVDALAIGPVAAKNGTPVLITRKDTVPSEVKEFLKNYDVKKVTIIGGENTVSKKGMEELSKLVGEVIRVSGPNRIETSLTIAKKYFTDPSSAFIANGWKNADALIGGYYAGMTNAPIILTNQNGLGDTTLEYLSNKVVKAYLLGGESVLSNYVYDLAKWVLIGGIKPSIEPIVPPIPVPDNIEYLASVEQEIFKLVNSYRVSNGLHQYKWDDTLHKSARYKSRSMIEHNYFDHSNPQLGNMSASDLIWKQYGAKYSRVGENIAATMGSGKASADKIFTMWKNSTGHNAAMLSANFTHMSVGVTYTAKGGSRFSNTTTTTATQHFGG